MMNIAKVERKIGFYSNFKGSPIISYKNLQNHPTDPYKIYWQGNLWLTICSILYPNV